MGVLLPYERRNPAGLSDDDGMLFRFFPQAVHGVDFRVIFSSLDVGLTLPDHERFKAQLSQKCLLCGQSSRFKPRFFPQALHGGGLTLELFPRFWLLRVFLSSGFVARLSE